MTIVKKIIYFILISILFFNCDHKKKPGTLQSTTGYTNVADQEYILISQDFDNRRYEQVINFVNKFYKNYSLDLDNIKLYYLKAQAREKLAIELNERIKNEPKDTIKKARELGYKITDDRIIYLFEEYREIWKNFPKTEYGKDAFKKYILGVDNYLDKIDAYQELIELTDNKKEKDQLEYNLSMIYLYEYRNLNDNRLRDLIELYKKLMTTEYKDKIMMEYFLISFKYNNDQKEYIKNLQTLSGSKGLQGLVANYLLGELFFISGQLNEAKENYLQAKKLIKSVKNSEPLPGILIQIENLPSSASISLFKENIGKKLTLISKILDYQKKLNDKTAAVISGERVRIRKTPSVSNKNVITTLNYGDRVIILSKSKNSDTIEGQENYWYNIQLMDNTTGWVFGTYLIFFIY